MGCTDFLKTLRCNSTAVSSLRECREDWRDLSSASVELASFALRSGGRAGERQCGANGLRRTVVWIKVLPVEETLVEDAGVLLDVGGVLDDLVWVALCAGSEAERDGWQGGHGGVCWVGYLCISEGHALLHLVVYGGPACILPGRGCLCEL